MDRTCGQFSDRLVRVFKDVGGSQHDYECFLSTRVSVAQQILEALGDESKKLVIDPAAEPEIAAEFARDRKATPNADTHILLRLSASGLDPFGAAESAIAQARIVHDTLQMFTSQTTTRLRAGFVIVRRDGETVKVSPDQFRALDTVPMLQGESTAADASRALPRVSAVDRERITSALQFLHISLSAATDETKLVTAWMGLEAIARSSPKAAIEQICDFVSNCSALTSFDRLLNNLAFRINVYLDCQSDNPAAEIQHTQKTTGGVDAKSLARLLFDKTSTPALESLQNQLAGNPLLIYRMHRLGAHRFRDADHARKAILGHQKHVAWQLRRLARLRNDIVHRGTWDRRYRSVVSHLQTYLQVAIASVLHDVAKVGAWGLTEVALHRSFRFKRMLDGLTAVAPKCDLPRLLSSDEE
jgi:hypothetical protein